MIGKLAKISDIKQGVLYECSLQTTSGPLSVMLYKKDGKYLAFKNLCPHHGRRMDYAAGKFLVADNGNIVCPAHGAEFNIDDGLCITGPCQGKSLESIQLQFNESDIFTIIK
ncbi:hypothetical protein MNBD_GAMMA01-1916 [hydrothermal vent metagenome]|uniref:Rieske domain-containing protein n=1 Tax=hydrothermal vent metagenome TaxID=652676 RepID=A0A3B0V829_9ZZZZ